MPLATSLLTTDQRLERFPLLANRLWLLSFVGENRSLANARSLVRDYEHLPENHEGIVYVVMVRLMLRRLEKIDQSGQKRQLNTCLQTPS